MKKIGCTLMAALLGTVVANAALLGEYTFNDTGSGDRTIQMAAAMGSSSVAAGMSLGQLGINTNTTTQLDFAGFSSNPNTANDGFGFGGYSGQNIMFLHRAERGIPSAWGSLVGTGVAAPLNFTVTADAGQTVTVESVSINQANGPDILYFFQEAGEPRGASTLHATANTTVDVPLTSSVTIAGGTSKTFTLLVNSGAYNQAAYINNIGLNGSVIPEADSATKLKGPPAGFTLWQLPSQGHKQMMSYVIQTEDGKVIVIDGGNTIDGPYLKDFLVARGNHVDSWFITHPHKDHSDALSWILANQGDLVIDEIYASFPPVEWMDQHYDPNAKSGEQAFTDAMANAGKSHIQLKSGEVLDIDEIHIEVLAAGFKDITHNSANNFSLVMLFSDPTKTVLFTGDLGPLGGEKVLSVVDPDKLKADYVQMAHHGQGCPKKNFWQVVQPDYCLWPTPLWLWNNDIGDGFNTGPYGTITTRRWIEDLSVKGNYVSGVDGLVEIK